MIRESNIFTGCKDSDLVSKCQDIYMELFKLLRESPVKKKSTFKLYSKSQNLNCDELAESLFTKYESIGVGGYTVNESKTEVESVTYYLDIDCITDFRVLDKEKYELEIMGFEYTPTNLFILLAIKALGYVRYCSIISQFKMVDSAYTLYTAVNTIECPNHLRHFDAAHVFTDYFCACVFPEYIEKLIQKDKKYLDYLD